MSSPIWAIGLACIAILALFVIPIWGSRRFKPNRARHVKYAEHQYVEIVQRRVVELAVHHPEISKIARFDRHPFYLGPHLGVLGYSLCIFAGAVPTSNVTSMGTVTRYTMATCFLIGAVLILTGATMGSRLGRWRFARHVHDHPTSPLLGDDVSLPYLVGCTGLLCVAVSMSIYAWTSFGSTTGSLGGWLTMTLAGSSIVMLGMLWNLSREFEHNEQILLAEVNARIECDDDDTH